MKLITSRYAGRCRTCQRPVQKGEEVYWAKRQGSHHKACYKPPEAPLGASGDSPNGTGRAREGGLERGFTLTHPVFHISYRELVEKYRRVIKDENAVQDLAPLSSDVLSPLRTSWIAGERFYGCSSEQLLDWVAHGYKPELMKGRIPLPSDKASRRRIRYADSGELDFELAWSGFDYPFRVIEPRPTKPSMRINIAVNFLSHVRSTTVESFLVWCAKIMQRLETDGIDCAVNISKHSTGAFAVDPESRTQIDIEVKRVNEKFSFASWSAIVSPGGYRHLGFLAIILSAQALDFRCPHGLGRSPNASWGVRFDSVTRELQISSDPNASSFPVDLMEASFLAALKQAS